MPDLQPNFVNPQYVTPEQLKFQRDYAAQLLGGKGQQEVHRPLQGVSNIVNALVGGYMGHQADVNQQDALQNAAKRDSALTQQLIGGQVDPNTVGQTLNDPQVSGEQKALVRGLISPNPVSDVYGRPGYQSPAAGIRGVGVQNPQAYTPGFRGEEKINTDKGGISAPQTYPAPPAPNANAPIVPRQVQTIPQGNTMGGMEQGIEKINRLSKVGADNSALTKIIDQDTTLANDAQNIQKFAGTLKDLIIANHGKMTFGPTADMSQEIKKGIVNYFPGMKDVLGGGVAAADAAQKMTASLAPVLARQLGGGTGTDASLENGLRAVPGIHNSEEGAVALAEMVMEGARQQQAVQRYAMEAKTPQEYYARKNEYMAAHPILNPLTGNPIQMDIGQAKLRNPETAGGWQNINGVKIREKQP